MLKSRVIPTLLWKDHGLVKGVGFDSWRRVGTVLPAIKIYNLREVDEIIVVDITATGEKREPDYETVKEFCLESFIPMTIGGGVRSVEHIRKLLESGADKVSINSVAYERPELITEASNRFGAQCVVASIDVRIQKDRFECFSHSGSHPTGWEPKAWALEMELRGAGEILLTSVEKDGTMEGYDVELVKQVAQAVSIPVIASGGSGGCSDMHAALKEGEASAVAAASIFHFTQQTPMDCKKFLAEQGVAVRMPA
jgi:cyclase